MEKVLVLGGSGMLGHKLCQVLGPTMSVYAAVRAVNADTTRQLALPVENIFSGLEAESEQSLTAIFASAQPSVVINCVGIVKQLELASERLPSIAINSLLPHRLYQICKDRGARLIHLSTDCVFSGKKGNYTEDDFADAYDVYGRSKWLGEVLGEGALTIRTSIIGRQLSSHRSLLDWFLLNKSDSVGGYSKAIFSGLTTLELSIVIGRIISDGMSLSGLYQVASDPIDKYRLLNLIKRVYGSTTTIELNDQFAIDRSLCDDKFRAATDIERKPWPIMMEEMHEFDQGRY